MKNAAKFFNVLLAAFFCVSLSGCWFVIVGGAGAVTGYAISRDTFEGVSNKSEEELMAASHKVLSIMGNIITEDPKGGRIVGIVYGNHVTVDVMEINLTTSKLRVKARYGIFPRAGVAQEIYTKIISQLE